MEIKFSQAIDGFLLAKEVVGCSPHTLRNYALNLRRFAASLDGDPPMGEVTADHVRAFLHQLQTTHLTPTGEASRPARPAAATTSAPMNYTLASICRSSTRNSSHIPRTGLRGIWQDYRLVGRPRVPKVKRLKN